MVAHRPNLTPGDREAIVRAYREHVRVDVIVERFGIWVSTLYQLLHAEGEPLRGQRRDKPTTERAMADLAIGYAAAETLRLRAQLTDGYPTSNDPLIIGEHEVKPVECPHCKCALPWALVKGWR